MVQAVQAAAEMAVLAVVVDIPRQRADRQHKVAQVVVRGTAMLAETGCPAIQAGVAVVPARLGKQVTPAVGRMAELAEQGSNSPLVRARTMQAVAVAGATQG